MAKIKYSRAKPVLEYVASLDEGEHCDQITDGMGVNKHYVRGVLPYLKDRGLIKPWQYPLDSRYIPTPKGLALLETDE